MLDEKAKLLMTAKGYDKAFTNILSSAKVTTQVEAFQILEQEYKSYFGKTKYTNFQSYRNARNIRLKRK